MIEDWKEIIENKIVDLQVEVFKTEIAMCELLAEMDAVNLTAAWITTNSTAVKELPNTGKRSRAIKTRGWIEKELEARLGFADYSALLNTLIEHQTRPTV